MSATTKPIAYHLELPAYNAKQELVSDKKIIVDQTASNIDIRIVKGSCIYPVGLNKVRGIPNFPVPSEFFRNVITRVVGVDRVFFVHSINQVSWGSCQQGVFQSRPQNTQILTTQAFSLEGSASVRNIFHGKSNYFMQTIDLLLDGRDWVAIIKSNLEDTEASNRSKEIKESYSSLCADLTLFFEEMSETCKKIAYKLGDLTERRDQIAFNLQDAVRLGQTSLAALGSLHRKIEDNDVEIKNFLKEMHSLKVAKECQRKHSMAILALDRFEGVYQSVAVFLKGLEVGFSRMSQQLNSTQAQGLRPRGHQEDQALAISIHSQMTNWATMIVFFDLIRDAWNSEISVACNDETKPGIEDVSSLPSHLKTSIFSLDYGKFSFQSDPRYTELLNSFNSEQFTLNEERIGAIEDVSSLPSHLKASIFSLDYGKFSFQSDPRYTELLNSFNSEQFTLNEERIGAVVTRRYVKEGFDKEQLEQELITNFGQIKDLLHLSQDAFVQAQTSFQAEDPQKLLSLSDFFEGEDAFKKRIQVIEKHRKEIDAQVILISESIDSNYNRLKQAEELMGRCRDIQEPLKKNHEEIADIPRSSWTVLADQALDLFYGAKRGTSISEFLKGTSILGIVLLDFEQLDLWKEVQRQLSELKNIKESLCSKIADCEKWSTLLQKALPKMHKRRLESLCKESGKAE